MEAFLAYTAVASFDLLAILNQSLAVIRGRARIRWCAQHAWSTGRDAFLLI
jgi:hypothetical protein